MQRLPRHPGSLSLALSCALAALSCADEAPPGPSPASIVVDEWERVVDEVPFPEGVQRIYVGGTLWQDNFVNRGQVEVLYDAPPGTISVELRRFAAATSQADAQNEFDATNLWAYSVDPPERPNASIETESCVEVWRDDCHVRVWFDGMVQPLRVGADIRLIVPPGWEGHLEILTEETEPLEDEAMRRSDVTLDGLAGTADVDLGSGAVTARLDPDIEVAPGCSAEENETCEAAGWTPDCGCVDFGRLQIRANGELGAEVVVDAPAGLWIDACFENAAATDAFASCSATMGCDDFDDCELMSFPGPTPWKVTGDVNSPGEADGGYAIAVESAACSLEDDATVGHQRLCSGCLSGG